jgi:hypothetical protein
MHYVYGFCDGNALAAVDEYRRRFPDGRIPSRAVFTRIHQTLLDTGSFPSVNVSLEREAVETINRRENILEMVERSPRLLTRGMAFRISVTRMHVFRTLHEEYCYPFHHQTAQHLKPSSTFDFVPLDTSTSRTVRRHFIHRRGAFYS